MDKIDGPYYFFGVLAKLAALPSLTPMMLPDTGRTNIVPVDFVADAIVQLAHLPGADGRTFHLTAPKTIGLRGIYRAVAPAAGLPPLVGTLPRAAAGGVLKARGRAKVLRDMAATQLGVPGEIPTWSTWLPRQCRGHHRRTLPGPVSRYHEFRSYAPKRGGTGPRTWIRTGRSA
jgi:thioester reductase-like protein